MDNLADKLALSVLVTREEYCEAAANQQRRQRKRIAPIITGVGVILLLLGLSDFLYAKDAYFSSSIAFCLIVIGIFVVCYDSVFAPMFNKAEAVREFEEKEDLHFASTYVFENNMVNISNGKVTGKLPLTMVTRWSETGALFTLAFGREISMAIPKRLMETQQCDWLRKQLETNAGGAKI